jgi:hypothetical protein
MSRRIVVQERRSEHVERSGARRLGGFDRRCDVLRPLDRMNRELDAARARAVLQRLELPGRIGVGVGERSQAARAGNHIEQQFLPFAVEVAGEDADPRRIAARTGERGDYARTDHIVGDGEDGDGLRRRPGGANGRLSGAQDGVHLGGGELRRDRRILLVWGRETPAVDREVATLDEAEPAKLVEEPGQDTRRQRQQHPDPPHALALLGARRERP